MESLSRRKRAANEMIIATAYLCSNNKALLLFVHCYSVTGPLADPSAEEMTSSAFSAQTAGKQETRPHSSVKQEERAGQACWDIQSLGAK